MNSFLAKKAAPAAVRVIKGALKSKPVQQAVKKAAEVAKKGGKALYDVAKVEAIQTTVEESVKYLMKKLLPDTKKQTLATPTKASGVVVNHSNANNCVAQISKIAMRGSAVRYKSTKIPRLFGR